jgi:type IV pilus assembly protein PilP
MKIANSLKTCFRYFAFITAVISIFAFALPSTTRAQVTTANETEADSAMAESIKVAEALKDLLASMNIKPFTYQAENRPDPFVPFISDKILQEVAETKPDELTGMRQFEPGQLTLVAIMFSEGSPMAMVEDSSHKGYLVRKGTKIGKSGIISDILPNQVIIKQLSYSMTREKRYNTVEMTLRKEGEK